MGLEIIVSYNFHESESSTERRSYILNKNKRKIDVYSRKPLQYNCHLNSSHIKSFSGKALQKNTSGNVL
jgi:hypothetical protein